MALALACALLFACGCGGPAVYTETELITEIISPAETAAERESVEFQIAETVPQDQRIKISVNEIDMAAPESESYRAWLKAYCAQLYEPDGFIWSLLPEPATRQEADKHWKTWDWNDAWVVEQFESYGYNDEVLGILCARNNATGETYYIEEIYSWKCVRLPLYIGAGQ
jgi:hypothetical protein